MQTYQRFSSFLKGSHNYDDIRSHFVEGKGIVFRIPKMSRDPLICHHRLGFTDTSIADPTLGLDTIVTWSLAFRTSPAA